MTSLIITTVGSAVLVVALVRLVAVLMAVLKDRQFAKQKRIWPLVVVVVVGIVAALGLLVVLVANK